MKKRKWIKIIGTVLLAGHIFAQGPLTPPGAPAPTMKTLEQVEPRTPISSLPVSILEPGSYYLESNLSGDWGISIRTSNVTIDLMGFTISGTGGNHGIRVSGSTNAPLSNIVIRNGMISNFGDGIQLENADHVEIRDMLVTKNIRTGIEVVNARFSKIMQCIASSNKDGIFFLPDAAGETIGVVVDDCVLSANSSYGIIIHGGSGPCQGNRISNCLAEKNGSTGFSIIRNASHNEIINCSSIDNGLFGINIWAPPGEVCEGNSIIGCTVRGNVGRGIYVYGAHRGRIEGNHVSHTSGGVTYGIWTENSTNNVVCKNICTEQTFNYYLSPADQAGPVATEFGAGAFGRGLDPWANFDF